MSITQNDMQAFLSAEISDDDPTKNGGRPSAAPMPMSAKNNAFRDVTSAQRSAGASRLRKIFLANLNPDLAGEAPMVVMDKPTAYGDVCYFSPATFDDHESDVSFHYDLYRDIYGSAMLAEDAAEGDTQIRLTVESGTWDHHIFAAGREVLISTRPAFENTTGSVGGEALHVIASNDGQSTTNGVLTVTLTAPLERGFSVAEGARASTVYRPPTIAATVSSSRDSLPVQLSNRGAIRQRWTLGLGSSTYTITGDTVGELGEYRYAAAAAPVNPAAYAGGHPYLTIPANGLAEFASSAGNEIVFETNPSMTPIWVYNQIPAGVDEYGLTDVGIGWQLESPA